MKFESLHPWVLTPLEAITLQNELAERVVLKNSHETPFRKIAGADVSYKKHGNMFHAAVVVLDANTMAILDSASASGEVNFPYVPGLLSFRELPVLLQAFAKLETVPDIVMADSQGIAHPRRLGLASHLGLWLDLPTIGCAKSRLCGDFDEPGPEMGAYTLLLDKGEEIGRVLRTKDHTKPLFVSPGHKIDFCRAASVVLESVRGYKLPEPTRQAHLLSNRIRTEHDKTCSNKRLDQATET